MQETIKEIKKRIEKVFDKEKVVVIYHFDIDGCASASLMWRILQKNHKEATYIPATRGYEAMIARKIKKENPDKVVILDYVPSDELVNFLKNYDAEIIDHHKHEERLEKLDYFTSSDFEIGASLSYLLFKVAEKFEISNVSWLGYLGSFWDKCMESTEFYKKGIYQEKVDELIPFNLVVSLTRNRGSEKMLQLMNKSSSLDEAFENLEEIDDYHRAKKLFEHELRSIMFSKKNYPELQLDIYWVKTKFKHIRIYVDYITFSNEGSFLFILDEISRFKFSFRTSLELSMLNIVLQLKEKFENFKGGGHLKACGGLLDSQNVEELLSEFLKLYEKEYKKIGAK